MAKEKTLGDLFYDTLKDLYFAEAEILKALPKMAKAAKNRDLRAAFEKHRDETKTHIERLDKVFDFFGQRASGKPCAAINGILEEGEEIMSEYAGSDALEAGLIGSAQAIEHYEITRYGTLKRWAEMLGEDEIIELLEQTLSEEKKTDALLSELAETLNEKAAVGAS